MHGRLSCSRKLEKSAGSAMEKRSIKPVLLQSAQAIVIVGTEGNVSEGITRHLDGRMESAARKAGIQVHGDFIIGLPGETPGTIEETFRAALRLKPATMQVSIALPLPGTEFYNWLKENKYLKSGSHY